MKQYRVYFEKKSEAIYISHLDLQRVVIRALKKSRIPAKYSEGYNPHIYVAFALPLSLGQGSVCESFDFKCNLPISVESSMLALNSALPSGITVTNIKEATTGFSSIISADYSIFYGETDKSVVADALSRFQLLPKAIVLKKNKKNTFTEIDLKEYIENINVMHDEECVSFSLNLPAGNLLTINPMLFCEFLEQEYDIPRTDAFITRTRIYCKDGNFFE